MNVKRIKAFNKAQLITGISPKLCVCAAAALRLQDVRGQRSDTVFNMRHDFRLIRRLPEFVPRRVFFKALSPGVLDVPSISHGYPLPFMSFAAHCALFLISRLKIKWGGKKYNKVLECISVAALEN